ncbi:hypothetical protein BDC45DRAFT_533938 [Circinella umbellata]|nr:hypothetical protein BDC45DRAFT_533938 [Circinella umbellata]
MTTDNQYTDASNEPSFSKQKNNNVEFISHHDRQKAQYDTSTKIKNITCFPPETVFTNINQLSMIINKKRLCASMDASFGKTLFTCMLVPAGHSQSNTCIILMVPVFLAIIFLMTRLKYMYVEQAIY